MRTCGGGCHDPASKRGCLGWFVKKKKEGDVDDDDAGNDAEVLHKERSTKRLDASGGHYSRPFRIDDDVMRG